MKIENSVYSLVCLLSFSLYGQRCSNVALKKAGSSIEVTQGAVNRFFAPEAVIDGDVSDDTAIRIMGIPAVLDLVFSEEREVNCVRLYPGLLGNADSPSGACPPVSYEIDGYVNNGWAPLAKVERAALPKSGTPAKDYFFEHKFPSMYLSKLRLRILASGDTGHRMTDPGKVTVPESRRVSIIRDIQVYESIAGKYACHSRANYLSGDFRAPFYRNSKQARLDMISAQESATPQNAEVYLYAPGSEKIIRSMPFVLHKGMNALILDIGGLGDGRYPVKIEVKKGKNTESIFRLLRIDNGMNTVNRKQVCDVTGKRVYLFDDYHLEKDSDMVVRVNAAKPYLAAWMKLAPGQSHWRNKVLEPGFTSDNKLVISFQDGDEKGYHWRYAICSDPLTHPDKWDVHDGQAPKIERVAGLARTTRKSQDRPKLRTSFDHAVFRFYDAARDGVPPLNEIYVLHTGVKRREFSGLPIPYRSTYAVWEKKPGEIIFLSKAPLVIDTILPGGDTLESETDTSDNFGGQHLSGDGKILYYIVGRVVKRFPPYAVEYDNQRFSCRLLTAFYTTDGFHWKKQFILPVTENDPWSLQQYGATIFKDPGADLYWGFLSSYNCQKQQMYIDVIFSRDLINWTRPEGGPFIASSPTSGDWRFGLLLPPSVPALELKGHEFIFMKSVLCWPHFYHDLRGRTSPEAIRKRYALRRLESMWPFFKEIGSYEKLSEAVELAFSRRPLGVAVARPGSYVAREAGAREASLTTRLFRAEGRMSLNAQCNGNGWIRIELLDADGKPIHGHCCDFSSDSLDQTIFTRLPDVPFKVKITMKNARLFALTFTPSQA